MTAKRRAPRRLLLALAVAVVAVGCGDPPLEAGEPCEPTRTGAARCRFNRCLQFPCLDGKQVNVCAGQTCRPTGSSCSDPLHSCVKTSKTSAYCLPTDICR